VGIVAILGSLLAWRFLPARKPVVSSEESA